jgi:hypothetical protein
MDDNIWEYPFGDLEDDEDVEYRKPDINGSIPCSLHQRSRSIISGFIS